MNAQPETAHLVRQWVDKAEEDLTNAEHTLTLREDCPLGTICFHAQQCVEKYLKALLTYHAVPFPKTHDLLALLNLVPVSHRPDIDLDQLSMVNRYSVEARYPGDWEPITRADAQGAVALTLGFRESIRATLPDSVLP